MTDNHLRVPVIYTADWESPNPTLLPVDYPIEDIDNRHEFTQSMWKSYGKCQWKFHLNYIQRIVRKTKSLPLEFGTLMHEMVQTNLGGGEWADSIRLAESWEQMMLTAKSNGETSLGEDEIRDSKDLSVVLFERWMKSDRDFEILTLPYGQDKRLPLIEVRGRVPLNGTSDYAFGFDGIVARGSEIYVWEFKTTAISSMDDYARSIEFEPQAWGYVWAAKRLFGRCDGIMYDVVRKRKAPPIKTLACRRKSCNMDPDCPHCAGTGIVGIAKTNKDSTLDEWDDTINLLNFSPKGREQIVSGAVEEIRKTLERTSRSYHYRILKRPSQEYLDAFEAEITAAANEVAEKKAQDNTNRFVKMRGNCRVFNRDCTYLPICPHDNGDGSRLFMKVSGEGPVELDVKEIRF